MNALVSHKKAVKTFFTLLCIIGSVTTFAWPFQLAKRRAHTVLITGNYEQPRLLADLVQLSTNQPYIILPRTATGKIYFCPVNEKKFIALERDELNSFLIRLRPRQVILLGDVRYVPAKCEKLLKKNNVVVRIQGESWEKISITVSQLLNAQHVPANFKKLKKELEEHRFGTKATNPTPVIETPAEIEKVPAIEPPVETVTTQEKIEIKEEKNSSQTPPVIEQEPTLIEDTHSTIK
jgi:hypothetical protein